MVYQKIVVYTQNGIEKEAFSKHIRNSLEMTAILDRINKDNQNNKDDKTSALLKSLHKTVEAVHDLVSRDGTNKDSGKFRANLGTIRATKGQKMPHMNTLHYLVFGSYYLTEVNI